MNCPVCGTELHLELASGDLGHDNDRARAWSDAVNAAELREARNGPEELPYRPDRST